MAYVMKIALRDFVRQFKKHKNKKYLVVYGRCGIVGVWQGGGVNLEEPLVLIPGKVKFGHAQVIVNAKDVGSGQVEIETAPERTVVMVCAKCGKPCVGTFVEYNWETGEEHEVNLCKNHSKGFSKKP